MQFLQFSTKFNRKKSILPLYNFWFAAHTTLVSGGPVTCDTAFSAFVAVSFAGYSRVEIGKIGDGRFINTQPCLCRCCLPFPAVRQDG